MHPGRTHTIECDKACDMKTSLHLTSHSHREQYKYFVLLNNFFFYFRSIRWYIYLYYTIKTIIKPDTNQLYIFSLSIQ